MYCLITCRVSRFTFLGLQESYREPGEERKKPCHTEYYRRVVIDLDERISNDNPNPDLNDLGASNGYIEFVNGSALWTVQLV